MKQLLYILALCAVVACQEPPPAAVAIAAVADSTRSAQQGPLIVDTLRGVFKDCTIFNRTVDFYFDLENGMPFQFRRTIEVGESSTALGAPLLRMDANDFSASRANPRLIGKRFYIFLNQYHEIERVAPYRASDGK